MRLGTGLLAVVILAAVAGECEACVSDRVLNSGTNSPTIQIINNCSNGITWAMCLNVSSRNWRDFPAGVTAAHAVSNYGLYLQPGDQFTYRYSWCEGNCRPQQPTC